MPTPEQLEALREVVDTRAALLQIETHDELRVQALFDKLARQLGRELWTWSATRGLRVQQGLKLRLTDFGNTAPPDSNDTKELPAALAQLQRMDGAWLVLLLDIHPYLSNPLITRALKELALQAEAHGQQIVLVGHDIPLPDELAPWSARFELEPMTLPRVQALFKDELARHRSRREGEVSGARETLDSLLRHMVGLPEASVRHLVRLTLADGQVTTHDLARVLAAKHETLGAAELLVFEQDLPSMHHVAGMQAFKRWLGLRREPFLQGKASGLPSPRGVLLLGVQGAGKSLAAKAVASAWQVPLFRMDFGALFDKFQGESERKLREALKVADAMQPCVLWMDEVEKGLAGGGSGEGDTGTGQRMLGTLLTWMAERKAAVFLVATANDIEGLPPELMRKGRFDEIFFVDLPTPVVRAGILRIHLAKHRIAFDDVQLQTLVVASEGFSGAEIEAAVVAARYEAHARTEPASTPLVAAEMARTRPLSVTRAEAIAALRAWAADRTVCAEGSR
ncbi:MAG: AAA family ATPase [Rubrivivax sp.]